MSKLVHSLTYRLSLSNMSVVGSDLSLFEAFQGLQLSVILSVCNVVLHVSDLLLFASRYHRWNVWKRSQHSFLANWHVFIIKARTIAEPRLCVQIRLTVVLLRHQVWLDRWNVLQLLELYPVADYRCVYDRVTAGRDELGRLTDCSWLEQGGLLVFHRLQVNVGLLSPLWWAHIVLLNHAVSPVKTCVLGVLLVSTEVDVRGAKVGVVSDHV